MYVRAGLLWLLLMGAAVAQTVRSTEAPEWRMDRLHDQRAVAGITTVMLNNPWGDVRLRRSENGLLEIHAVAQSRDAGTPRLKAQVTEGRLRWIIQWQDERDEPAADRRVDVVLWLPPGPALELWLETGRLWMKKPLDNHLKIRSQGSDLELKARGDVDAWSAHGDVVLYSLLDGARPTRQKLASSSGTVKLVFNQLEDIRIEALTGGDVLVDLPDLLAVKKQGRYRVIQRGRSLHWYQLQSDGGDVLLVYRALLEPPP